ncbi:MAG: AAA family ATPase, partial [Desulfurococcaceae archaeon]
MRILGIFLENIRSYKKNIIVFPHRGITVIHGPSGSGKTSLLMSISYALFGIASGSIKSRDLFEAYEHPHGADLLRVDSTRGRVRILISARGRLYVIERWITKEGNSFVSRDGLIEEYTVDQNNLRLASKRQFSSRMEIDEHIASIVGLREKYRERGNPKPLVYPSALYVPQFNVHEVLQLSEEERREIVERALGLDKYKLFRVNYEKISKVLNQRLREAEIKISEVSKRLREKNRESIIKERERLLAEYEKMNRDKNLIELEYRRVKDVDSKLQVRLRELELKRQELLKILDEHDKITKNIGEVKRRICDLFELGSLDEELTAVERIRRELEIKLKEFERKKDQLDGGLTSIDKEVEQVEGELKRIRE